MPNDIFLWFPDNIEWGHDNSVSMIANWRIYAIEIERLDKLKHSSFYKYWKEYLLKDYLKWAINYIFKNISFEENQLVVSNFNLKYKDIKVDYHVLNNHHLLHASSAYYWTLFDNATILVVDNKWYTKDKKELCQSIFKWEKNNISMLDCLEYSSNKWQFWIWKAFLLHSKLVWLEEGSLMWLSAYWKASRFKDIKIFEYEWNNVYFNRTFFNDRVFSYNDNDLSEDIAFLRWLYWITEEDYVQKEKDITKSIFADIAAKIQKETEEAMVYLANIAYNINSSKNLCIAWWVALNILANTEILKKTKFENVFICSSSNDWGLSLWVSYYLYHNIWNYKKRLEINSAWLWNIYSDNEIEKELTKFTNYLEFRELESYSIIAKILDDNKIIWWFQWWSEFWPRSLWFRSILASPKSIDVKNRVNKIKSREYWRPVAPSILEEELYNYFDTENTSPFMTFSSSVKYDKRYLIPAVVHIDWTSRYHTVNKKQNIKFYELLKEFYNFSGIPVLINTSFNVKWQPIVESPKDAIEMFLSTDLDYLIIGKYIVKKQKIYTKFKFNRLLVKLNTKFKNKKKVLEYLKLKLN